MSLSSIYLNLSLARVSRASTAHSSDIIESQQTPFFGAPCQITRPGRKNLIDTIWTRKKERKKERRTHEQMNQPSTTAVCGLNISQVNEWRNNALMLLVPLVCLIWHIFSILVKIDKSSSRIHSFIEHRVQVAFLFIVTVNRNSNFWLKSFGCSVFMNAVDMLIKRKDLGERRLKACLCMQMPSFFAWAHSNTHALTHKLWVWVHTWRGGRKISSTPSSSSSEKPTRRYLRRLKIYLQRAYKTCKL